MHDICGEHVASKNLGGSRRQRNALAVSKAEVRGVCHEPEVVQVAVLRAVPPSVVILMCAPALAFPVNCTVPRTRPYAGTGSRQVTSRTEFGYSLPEDSLQQLDFV